MSSHSKFAAAYQGRSDWEQYLDVHEFLDVSKAGSADRRHRIMLHHCDLGTSITEMAFPNLANAQDIVSQHVTEDLGVRASFLDWLVGVEQDKLPKPVLRRVNQGPRAIAQMVLKRCASDNSSNTMAAQHQSKRVHEVAELLWLPLNFAPGASFNVLSILMNSIGPLVVRKVFGPPVVVDSSQGRIVSDHGWIAEAVIMACFGRVPDLSEVIKAVKNEPGEKMERA